MVSPPAELARVQGARGEVRLRRRWETLTTAGGGPQYVDELIVNGIFAMDSAEVTSELELGRLMATGGVPGTTATATTPTTPAAARRPRRILIGGLGLGYTTTAAAAALGVSDRIDVVELEPALVAWAVAGVTETLAAVAADPRVRLVIADLAAVLRDEVAALQGETWDAIALDVDNGPDFLVHGENAVLYGSDLLAAAVGRLRPGGRLAIWCQGRAPALHDRLAALPGRTEVVDVPVRRGMREFAYAIYVHDRPPAADPAPDPPVHSPGGTPSGRGRPCG